MGSRTTSGRFLAAGTNRPFGVLLLVWFNLAMLPCAMAIGESPDQSGHPSGHDQAMASQHTHNDSAHEPCATMQLDCCDLGQAAFGDRSQTFEKKDSDKIGFVVAFDFRQLAPPVAGRVWTPSDPPDLGSGSPRLHVINCVYLD